MPMLIQRRDLGKIMRALDWQKRTGRCSLRLSNRCVSLVPEGKPMFNKSLRLIPKPMTLDEVSSVVKLTGFSPFLETKFVRG